MPELVYYLPLEAGHHVSIPPSQISISSKFLKNVLTI